jgi:hypothetical protein
MTREAKIKDILTGVLDDADATKRASDDLRSEARRIDKIVGDYAAKVGMDYYEEIPDKRGWRLAIKKGKKKGSEGHPWGIFRLAFEVDVYMQPEKNLADVPRGDLMELLDRVPTLVLAWAQKVQDFKEHVQGKREQAREIGDQLEEGF